MGWIITGVIAAVVIAYLLARVGNLKFWNVVKKHPMEAMQFFMNNPDVFAIKDVSHDQIDRAYYNTGPFLFLFLGQTFKIYANQERMKAKEDEFMQMF